MTGNTSAENRVSNDDFYVFNAGSTDGPNTMELMIKDKLVNIVIDSGASCNLEARGNVQFCNGVCDVLETREQPHTSSFVVLYFSIGPFIAPQKRNSQPILFEFKTTVHRSN